MFLTPILPGCPEDRFRFGPDTAVSGTIRWYTWVLISLVALFLWDYQWLLSAVFYGVLALGFILPLVSVVLMAAMKPLRDESDRHETTRSAYNWLTAVACSASLLVLILSGALVSLLGETEWQLGLDIAWELLGIPPQGLMLFFALRGLILAIKAERYFGFHVISIYTSLFFLLSASPGQLSTPVSGD